MNQAVFALRTLYGHKPDYEYFAALNEVCKLRPPRTLALKDKGA